jgi:hypothetical protein
MRCCQISASNAQASRGLAKLKHADIVEQPCHILHVSSTRHGRRIGTGGPTTTARHGESGLLSIMLFGTRGGYGLIDSVLTCRVYFCVMHLMSYKRCSGSPNIFFNLSSSTFLHPVQIFKSTKYVVQAHYPRHLGECSCSSESGIRAMRRTGLEWFEIMRLRIHMPGPGRILLPMRSW